MPSTRTTEAAALDVKCLWCGAPRGEACISQRDTSQRTKHPHPERVARLRTIGEEHDAWKLEVEEARAELEELRRLRKRLIALIERHNASLVGPVDA